MHMVPLDELLAPHVPLVYRKPRGKNSADSIYLFDQEAAKGGIVYSAEYLASTGPPGVFSIHVPEKDRKAAQTIIDRLNPPYRPKRSAAFCGWWTDIEPTRLAKAYKDHPWAFAIYRETASQRDDGLNYVAFLFRNQERTIFGIKEWLSEGAVVRNDVLGNMAHRVVCDRRFRASLISDDPDLPLLWKKR